MQLLHVQERIAAVIAADPWFAGTDIITERSGEIEQAVSRSLQKIGFGIVVATGSAEAVSAEAQRLRMKVECVVSVISNALTSDRTALEGADRIARLLHGLPLESDGQPVRRPEFQISAIRSEPTAGLAIHQVAVLCEVPMPDTDFSTQQ